MALTLLPAAAEPKADAERTRLVGRYQPDQVPAPPIQPKREAPGLPSPVALQPPPPPSPTASEQTTRYTGNPKPPPPPPAPLQLAAQPPPSLAGSQLNTTQGSSLQQQPPPSEQATAQPPPLPLVQPKQPQSTSKSPPAPSSTPVSQQQAGTDSSVTGSSSNTTSASTGASGSGAQQVVAQPPPGVIQLPTHSAATFNISESQQGSGQAEQAPPAQPGNATVTGAAKEAAQGLLSTVGQGVNATQTALAATGVLGGLAANEAVSASLPGNDSMAKGAAKALGDEGSGGTLAESGANQAAGTGEVPIMVQFSSRQSLPRYPCCHANEAAPGLMAKPCIPCRQGREQAALPCGGLRERQCVHRLAGPGVLLLVQEGQGAGHCGRHGRLHSAPAQVCIPRFEQGSPFGLGAWTTCALHAARPMWLLVPQADLIHRMVPAVSRPSSALVCQEALCPLRQAVSMLACRATRGACLSLSLLAACSGVPDDLMDDIPTVVVNPLPEGIDKVPSSAYKTLRLSSLHACCRLISACHI